MPPLSNKRSFGVKDARFVAVACLLCRSSETRWAPESHQIGGNTYACPGCATPVPRAALDRPDRPRGGRLHASGRTHVPGAHERDAHLGGGRTARQIGRASCRERVWV